MKRLFLLLLPLTTFAATPANDWAPNATGYVAWQANASNGMAEWDRIGALQVGADVLSSSRYDFSRTDVFHLTAHLGGDWFPRFSALNRGLGGARIDWQHTFGSDATAPVFTAELGGDAVAAMESARRGVEGAVTLSLSKRFLAGWRAALSQRFDDFNAKRSVFDRQGQETAVEVSRDINDATRLSIQARWRDGDVVTYAQYRRPDLAAIARASARLETFGRDMTAYSTDARTISGRAALIHATSEETALILAYEYARTTRTDLRFANSTITLSFIRQY